MSAIFKWRDHGGMNLPINKSFKKFKGISKIFKLWQILRIEKLPIYWEDTFVLNLKMRIV